MTALSEELNVSQNAKAVIVMVNGLCQKVPKSNSFEHTK
jgi:hypothetical protein